MDIKKGKVRFSADVVCISEASAPQKILLLLNILNEIGLLQMLPITPLQDNESTIKMIYSPN